MAEENILGRGYVHIYTGDGKGKTTAALGLALRAAGSGLRTYIVQFMKGQYYGELDSVKMLSPYVVMEQFGTSGFLEFKDTPDPDHVMHAHKAMERVSELMDTTEYNIIIADEIITAMLFHLIQEGDILKLMGKKPYGVEFVITGRGATESLIDKADLVTEMREIKHYYNTQGVIARKGIEM